MTSGQSAGVGVPQDLLQNRTMYSQQISYTDIIIPTCMYIHVHVYTIEKYYTHTQYMCVHCLYMYMYM